MDINAETLPDLVGEPFTGPEYQPFAFDGGEPAALLIHGFLGTPAEPRPLGEALHAEGWTAHAPLLPGCGTDVEHLFERTRADWLVTAERSLREIQRAHRPILLVGHSLGGALALHLAARHPVDGVVLLAPFWQLPLPHPALALVWPLIPALVRKVKPFKTMDLSRPEVHSFVNYFRPDLDLTDPQVRATIREMTVPTHLFDELFTVGRRAYTLAARVNTPKLILQGIQDRVVAPAMTRKLLQRLPGPLTYRELPASHYLLNPDGPTWDQIKQTILAFARQLSHIRGEQ